MLWVELGCLGVEEADAAFAERRLDREGDVLRLALAERQPDEAGVEHEAVARRDDLDVDIAVELVLDGERRSQAAEIAAEDEYLLASWLCPLSPTYETRACLLTPEAVGDYERGKGDTAEVGQRVLVVAGGDSAPLLESVEAALDGVAVGV